LAELPDGKLVKTCKTIDIVPFGAAVSAGKTRLTGNVDDVASQL
jgi:hypothetical protein